MCIAQTLKKHIGTLWDHVSTYIARHIWTSPYQESMVGDELMNDDNQLHDND